MHILTTRMARLLSGMGLLATVACFPVLGEAARIVALKSVDVDVYNEALEGFKSVARHSLIAE